MPKLIDLTGKRYGKLTVLNKAQSPDRYTRWQCLCDCGRTPTVRSQLLIRGETKSCGRCGGRGGYKLHCGNEYREWPSRDLTITAIADYFRVSTTTIYNWRDRGMPLESYEQMESWRRDNTKRGQKSKAQKV